MIVVLGCLLPGAMSRSQGQQQQGAYARGRAALDAKNYAEAADALQRAERQEPHKTDALLLRAKALIHLSRFEEAEQSLREYLSVHPESPQAAYLLAYVLFRRDLPTQSLQEYTSAARLQKPSADDFKIVGLDYVLLGDYPDAIRWLERSVAEAPNQAEAAYYLGRAYYVQNVFEKAIAAFKQALNLDPSYLKAENNLGLAFEATNQPDKAEIAYRKAIQMGETTGQRSDQPYINLAELISHGKQQSEALGLLNSAEQIGGKSERAEEVRGKILFSEDKLGEAEAAFRAALALDPKSGSLHYQLARVLAREGKTSAAENEFAQTKALLGTHSSGSN